MKKINKLHLVVVLVIMLAVGTIVYALGTSPDPKVSGSFAILADTFTNNSATFITGDLGYTTPPVVAATVASGSVYVADGVYNQAGIDQNSTLVALNNQVCTFTFAPGPIDLASDTTHGPVGVYTPGVYCMTGSANIGGGGSITLNGAGTYIFKIDGALTTSANSAIILSNNASACNVWWAPTSATTLGANSTFKGTIIDAAGITVGGNVNFAGSALAYGGTVTTDTDTIIVQTCTIDSVVVPAPVATSTPIVVPATTTPIVVTLATTTPVVVTSATTTPVIVAPIISPTPTIVVPKLPNTGFAPIN